MPIQRCEDYLNTASDQLDAANTAAASLDITQGLRAALPTALTVGIALANSYINSLMALTVGTRTQP